MITSEGEKLTVSGDGINVFKIIYIIIISSVDIELKGDL